MFNVASRGARKVQLCRDKHCRLAAASSWVRFLGGGGPYWAFLCGAGMFSPHLCGFSTDTPVLPPKSNTWMLGLICRRPRPDALIKMWIWAENKFHSTVYMWQMKYVLLLLLLPSWTSSKKSDWFAFNVMWVRPPVQTLSVGSVPDGYMTGIHRI